MPDFDQIRIEVQTEIGYYNLKISLDDEFREIMLLDGKKELLGRYHYSK